jgi:hypothetical protein
MKKILLFMLVTALLFSCKNKSVNESSTGEYDAFAAKVKQLNLKAENFEDVTAYLELTGADYMPGIANNPYNYEKYLSNVVMAAANMGVYMADGLYQFAYNEYTDGYNSITAARNIADNLGIGAAFDNLVMDRYNDTTVYADSLLASVGRSIAESKVLLNKEDKMQVFTGAIGGNYIEKLYILFNIIFEYNIELPEDAKLTILREVLLTTNTFLKKLPDVISLVESVKKETDPGTILDKLKEIEALRQQLKFRDEYGKLTPAMIFENQGLLDMYKKIKEVRGLIVTVPEK